MSGTSMSGTILDLSLDCTRELFSFLPFIDLVRTEVVCRKFHRFVENILSTAQVFSLQLFCGVGPRDLERSRLLGYPASTVQFPEKWYRILFRTRSISTLDLSKFRCYPSDVSGLVEVLSYAEPRKPRLFPKLRAVYLNMTLCNEYRFFQLIQRKYKKQLRCFSLVWHSPPSKRPMDYMAEHMVRDMKKWPLLESMEIEDFPSVNVRQSADAAFLFHMRVADFEDDDEDEDRRRRTARPFPNLRHLLVNHPRHLYEIAGVNVDAAQLPTRFAVDAAQLHAVVGAVPISHRLTSLTLCLKDLYDQFLSVLERRRLPVMFPRLERLTILGLALFGSDGSASKRYKTFIDFLQQHRATLRTLILDDVFFGGHVGGSKRHSESVIRVLTAVEDLEVLEYNNISMATTLSDDDLRSILRALPRLKSFRYLHVQKIHLRQ